MSFEQEDKRWLEQRSREEGVPMAELVRRAVRELRNAAAAEPGPAGASFEDLLRATSGTWPGGDALEHQRRLRADWAR